MWQALFGSTNQTELLSQSTSPSFHQNETINKNNIQVDESQVKYKLFRARQLVKDIHQIIAIELNSINDKTSNSKFQNQLNFNDEKSNNNKNNNNNNSNDGFEDDTFDNHFDNTNNYSLNLTPLKNIEESVKNKPLPKLTENHMKFFEELANSHNRHVNQRFIGQIKYPTNQKQKQSIDNFDELLKLSIGVMVKRVVENSGQSSKMESPETSTNFVASTSTPASTSASTSTLKIQPKFVGPSSKALAKLAQFKDDSDDDWD
eukprot:TRINITY_DN1384_c0_g4_i1.p1 TRINITY_DN1384_c0_g4~~TRINITY_DN1384_c0_g4_i1.p1  ORF type:complete len:261 (-),score=111.21 TRINITY_DN1384_c0_g4_i1:50-832(-)